MARDNVPITDLSLNGMVDRGAGVTIVVANGAEVQCNGNTDRLVIEVTNTSGADRNMTVKAGFGLHSCLGDKSFTIPATTGDKLICLDADRFVQNEGDDIGFSGKLLLDFASGFTGYLRAFRVPK